MINFTLECGNESASNYTYTDSHKQSFHQWPVVGVAIVLFLTGITGCTYDLWTLCHIKWQNHHRLLLAISCMDLLSMLLDFPGFVLLSLIESEESWPAELGEVLYYIWLYIDWVSNPLEILLIALLHLDHFMENHRKKEEPRQPEKSSDRVFDMRIFSTLMVIWIVSSVFSVPALLQHRLHSPFTRHYYTFWLMPYYILGGVAPFITTIIYAIYLAFHMSRRNLYFQHLTSPGRMIFRKSALSTSSSQVEFVQTPPTNHYKSGTGRQERHRRKTLLLLDLVYCFCYGPWIVDSSVSYFLDDVRQDTFLKAASWLVMLFPVIHPLTLALCHFVSVWHNRK